MRDLPFEAIANERLGHGHGDKSVWGHGQPPVHHTDRKTRQAIKDIVLLEKIVPLGDWSCVDGSVTELLYGHTSRFELLVTTIELWFQERKLDELPLCPQAVEIAQRYQMDVSWHSL